MHPLPCLAVLALLAALTGCGGDVPPDVAAEIPILESGGEEERYEAIAAIEEMGPAAAAAVPALRTLLRSTKDPDMQAEIAKALGAIGPSAGAAAPELTALLSSKEMWPRYTAAEALGSLGAAAVPALPRLQQLTKDRDSDVADVAKEAVRRLTRARRQPAATP